jgi:hypothetical protein
MESGIRHKTVRPGRIPISNQHAKGFEGWVWNGCFLCKLLVHFFSICNSFYESSAKDRNPESNDIISLCMCA